LKEPFDPANIVNAQSKDLHYFFYDTQDDMESWIEHSQHYQALATKLMTEAFRRDNHMISNAIHLFIDAWPSGWMKTIMDCDRNPKQAYFAYRNALELIMISLRTDRFTFYSGEEVSIEAFLCNDTNVSGTDYTMHYELYCQDELLLTGKSQAELKDCDVTVASDIRFVAPETEDRSNLTLKAILCDAKGKVVAHNALSLECFRPVTVLPDDDVILVTDLEPGEHEIAGEIVTVKECSMLPLHFVSRKTGHEIVEGFKERDFSYWYDREEDMITPILYKTFTAEGFTPILTSSNKDENGNWQRSYAAAIKKHDGKLYVICQVDLRQENPIAQRFLQNIYEYARKEKESL